MTKRLMIGLLTGVLMATLLPGVAVAKDKEDKSPCKSGGWIEWVRADDTDFADQSECVSYVAEGGTLAERQPSEPTPFQIACEGLDGTHEAPYLSYLEGCEWSQPRDGDTHWGYFLILSGYCPYSTSGYNGVPAWIACEGPDSD